MSYLYCMQNLHSQKARSAILKAALFKPLNLMILVGGCLAATFSLALIPVGVMAYGILCYLDVSNDDFVKKISIKKTPFEPKPAQQRPLNTMLPAAANPTEALIPELQRLQKQIAAMNQKIADGYSQVDDFTRQLIGNLSQIEEIAGKSQHFIRNAQQIAEYLAATDEVQIQRGIEDLRATLRATSDSFSRSQYQQALEHRQAHLQTIHDLQRIYERLCSQLTNIAVAFESIHSRIVKLSSADITLTDAESQAIAGQLRRILGEMEQLDAAMNAQRECHAP
ncbi:hypothetical protein U14_03621 [Candidatus Moduliflexus flocculans]|uniref:Uncharacterized protein n=1 Tax=Candidatus Moduliflexus flocculans TaxID=1499966 RepID=A0A081BPQ4_9BACT|nr:hypothetical protein U14_03621 [Candidatus Moduliflexus flocculans]